MKRLEIRGNQLTEIPNPLSLPRTLHLLDVAYNRLTTLPDTLYLLENLTDFNCHFNELTEIPRLPDTVKSLCCSFNRVERLPNPLPASLVNFILGSGHHMTQLPSPLPETLLCLDVMAGNLTSLPPLPSRLQMLYCTTNELTELPPLSHLKDLRIIWCGYNNLTQLPEPLPPRLKYLECENSAGKRLKIIPIQPKGCEFDF